MTTPDRQGPGAGWLSGRPTGQDRLDAVAIGLAAITGLAVVTTVDFGGRGVTAAVVTGLVAFVFGHLVTLKRLMLASTVPMLGPVVAEILFTGEQAWSRSLIIGCLWYAACEASLEGTMWRVLGRAPRPVSPDANAHSDTDAVTKIEVNEMGQAVDRVIDVLIVVGLSAVLVVGAAAATLLAPQRTAVVLALGVASIAVAINAAARAVSAVRDPGSGRADQSPA